MSNAREWEEKRLHKSGFNGYSTVRKWEALNRLVKDAVDMHVMNGQDYTGNPLGDNPVDRPYDDIDIAIRASEAGMKAIVFTCHVGPSFFRVPLIQKAADEWAEACDCRPVKVIGSITLNYVNGGLNPEVVRMLARFGGKVVVMPTEDGIQSRKARKLEGGIELVKNGKVVPALEEIMGIMADNKLVLCMTHSAAEERPILLDEGKKAGVAGFWTWSMGGLTDEYWVELAKQGLKWAPSHAEHIDGRGEAFNRAWNRMMKVGVENLLGGSSLNIWPSYRHPVEGFKEEIVLFLSKGMSESDAEKMFKINPAKLLDID